MTHINTGREKDIIVDSRRRNFLKLSAMLGLSAAVSTVVLPDGADAFIFGKRQHKVSKTKLVMGTYVTITTIHLSKDQAEEAIGLAFEEIVRLNSILSRHIPSTPIAVINANGSIKDAPPELVEVVQHSMNYYRDSSGAFDITVLPVLRLYEKGAASGRMPEDSEIEEIIKVVSSANIEINKNSIKFLREGVSITTDGIAKGYIVDRASKILLTHGIENHLINAGGDIVTHGNGAKGKPWTIAVQDPAKGREYPEIIRMTSGAVATSGNYEIFYDKEKLFHHIVNPTTGKSPLLSNSVTVMAPTVMAADALATAVFVLEPARGIEYINSRRDEQCLILDKVNNAHRSKGWITS